MGRRIKGSSRSSVVTARLMAVFDRLLAAFGPRHWWPGDTPFEVMVGAVLTQNTAWTNVEKAIANLKAARRLSPDAMQALSKDELAELIRPSGYFNVKADRLKSLIALVLDAGGGDPPRLLSRPADELRRDLLAVKGVGPETADSIVLYAAGYPSFVIDAYTRRIFSRAGLAAGDEPYETLRSWFMDHLPPDPALYNEYHALLVHLGKHFCRPKPLCGHCPLDCPVV